jgi:hypothetical protein
MSTTQSMIGLGTVLFSTRETRVALIVNLLKNRLLHNLRPQKIGPL